MTTSGEQEKEIKILEIDIYCCRLRNFVFSGAAMNFQETWKWNEPKSNKKWTKIQFESHQLLPCVGFFFCFSVYCWSTENDTINKLRNYCQLNRPHRIETAEKNRVVVCDVVDMFVCGDKTRQPTKLITHVCGFHNVRFHIFFSRSFSVPRWNFTHRKKKSQNKKMLTRDQITRTSRGSTFARVRRNANRTRKKNEFVDFVETI